MEIKATLRLHLTHVIMVIINDTNVISYRGECGARENVASPGGNTTLYSHYGNHYGGSSEKWKSI